MGFYKRFDSNYFQFGQLPTKVPVDDSYVLDEDMSIGSDSEEEPPLASDSDEANRASAGKLPFIPTPFDQIDGSFLPELSGDENEDKSEKKKKKKSNHTDKQK